MPTTGPSGSLVFPSTCLAIRNENIIPGNGVEQVVIPAILTARIWWVKVKNIAGNPFDKRIGVLIENSMLVPVAKETDADLLQTFKKSSRIQNAAPYNSVAVGE
jgi:hypothetical protein